VSNVLTRRKPVSPALAAKVEAAVRALNYRVDPLASMLRSGEARIVAVLVPDLDNPFFTSIVSALEQRLGGDAYEVIVASSHGAEATERSKLRAMLAWRPAGLVVAPCSDAFPGRKLIEASDTPQNLQQKMRTSGGIRLEAKTGKDNGREELVKVAGIKDVVVESDGDWEIFLMRVDAGVDAREEVFRLARDRQWAVRELAHRRATLEDVFVELTHSDQ